MAASECRRFLSTGQEISGSKDTSIVTLTDESQQDTRATLSQIAEIGFGDQFPQARRIFRIEFNQVKLVVGLPDR